MQWFARANCGPRAKRSAKISDAQARRGSARERATRPEGAERRGATGARAARTRIRAIDSRKKNARNGRGRRKTPPHSVSATSQATRRRATDATSGSSLAGQTARRSAVEQQTARRWRMRPKPTGEGKRPWAGKPQDKSGSAPGFRGDAPRARKPWSDKPGAAERSPWQTKPTGPRAQRQPWVGKPSGDRGWTGSQLAPHRAAIDLGEISRAALREGIARQATSVPGPANHAARSPAVSRPQGQDTSANNGVGNRLAAAPVRPAFMGRQAGAQPRSKGAATETVPAWRPCATRRPEAPVTMNRPIATDPHVSRARRPPPDARRFPPTTRRAERAFSW